MIAPQTYSSYPTFGTSATKCQPVQVKYETGYIPGDVLPAEHLNWFLAGATSNITLASAGIVNLQQEMQTILCCAGQAPSSCLTCVDQVYNAMMYQINASAAQRAPTAHASSATTYGVGTADSYGHLKISDTYTEVLSACSGVAASQKALACVYATAGAKAGVGNTAGCPLGTASAGVATTAARSDHVHPVTGLATTCVDSTNWPGIGVAGGYSTFIRTTECGFVPYCIDTTNGSGYLGVDGWPFKEVHAKNFYGTFIGTIWADQKIMPRDQSIDAQLLNVLSENFGYITRLRIGLGPYNPYYGFRDGYIAVGCSDDNSQWNLFNFRQGQGGDVITTATIGSQSVNHATCAANACCACCASEAQYLRSFLISNDPSRGVHYYYENGRTCMVADISILYWIGGQPTASPSILLGGNAIQILSYEGTPDICYVMLR